MKKLFLFLFIVINSNSFSQKTELVIRNGHAKGFRSFAFSPNKKLVATCSDDGSVILWDGKNHFQLKQYRLVKKGSMDQVTFSNDGKYLAASGKNIIAIIDAQTTNIIDTFRIEGRNSTIVFTKDDKYLVSGGGGDNGFVTVWRMEDKKQVTQFMASENMGFINGLAIAPDGKKMVVGGLELAEFDIPADDEGWKNIIITRRIQPFSIHQLAFSDGGKYLIVRTEQNGLISIDAATQKITGKIENLSYQEEAKYFSTAGNDEFIYAYMGVNKLRKLSLPFFKTVKAFSDSSHIESVLYDKVSNAVYGLYYDNNSVAFCSGENLNKPVSQFTAATNVNRHVAVSPDGKLIAINNEEQVVIFDVTEGKIIKKIMRSDNFFNYCYPLLFDKAGKYLYVNESQKITQWAVSNWKLAHTFAQRDHQISKFSLSNDGKYIATVDGGNYPEFILWKTETAAVIATKKFENRLEACAFSNDGSKIAVMGDQKLTCFSVPAATLLFEADKNVTGENVFFTPDDQNIYSFNRNAIYTTSVSSHTTSLLHSDGEPSESGYPVFAVSTAPDGKSFVTSGAGSSVMHSNMSDGIPFAKNLEHEDIVESVSFSGDGKFYVTAGKDGQVIFRSNKDSLLCKIFSIRNQSKWIVVMPDGRFDASMDALENLYFHKATEIIPLSSLFEKFYTPHLLPRLLLGERFASLDLDIKNVKQKPVVKIQYAEKQRNLEVGDNVPLYENNTGVAIITVTASSTDDGIDEIRLFQNGKILNLATRNLIVEDNVSKQSTKNYTVSLLPGLNVITAVALNTQRTESQPDIIDIKYSNGATDNNNVTPVKNDKTTIDKIDKNATLHLVVVGINQYKNPKMVLNYALADATAFKDELEKDAKTVVTNIKTYFVTDGEADKKGITNALQQVQQNAKPQDVFIFFYAGHGVIAGNKEFYLVPNDVADLKNVDEALKEHGIAAKDLQQYAINIVAQKQLFILDACQSAGAFADMLSDDGNQQKNIAMVARSTGTHWMAASGAQQFANEFSTLGHGAFTYVLLRALQGEAANKNMITVDGLKNYLQTGVPSLMKKYNGTQQTPASFGFGNDFPVQIVK